MTQEPAATTMGMPSVVARPATLETVAATEVPYPASTNCGPATLTQRHSGAVDAACRANSAAAAWASQAGRRARTNSTKFMTWPPADSTVSTAARSVSAYASTGMTHHLAVRRDCSQQITVEGALG